LKFDSFILWKLLTLAGEPLSIVACVLVFGWLLSWFDRWRKASAILLRLGAVLFLALAYGLPFTRSARVLEDEYKPIVNAQTVGNVKWIVVLGGGHAFSPGLPINSQVGSSSLYRIAEAVRLHRAIPGSRILFSGGEIYDSTSEAEVGREVAIALGVSPSQISIESRPRTTSEEFSCLRSSLGAQQFVLVTTALHMPRAMMLSESYGLKALPSPTDYRARSSGREGLGIWPRAGAFSLAAATFHEMVAIAGMRLRTLTGHSLVDPGLCTRLTPELSPKQGE
jgi:uncharacterized SAM-binding protein YcdF (DUF218 family)